MTITTMYFLRRAFVSSLLSVLIIDLEVDSRALVYRREYIRPRILIVLALMLSLMTLTSRTGDLWMLLYKTQVRRSPNLAKSQLRQRASPDEAEVLK